MKPRPLVEEYAATIATLEPARVVEIGIHDGGSTALLDRLCVPEKLVAIELAPKPPARLVQYIDRAGAGERVRVHCGVDQGDRTRVAAIVEAEFAGPLDLVVDDASHLYAPTLASFETLFPRVRPGGLFIIEDWRWEHLYSDHIHAAAARASDEERQWIDATLRQAAEAGTVQPPLTKLVIALLVARASSGEAVEALSVNEHWIVAQRGPADLDPATFRVHDLFMDHFGLL
jgi:predicted O-methyltransferase YrrM